VNDNIMKEFGVGFDFEARVDDYMEHLEIFSPPHGCLILAAVDSDVAGVGCIRTIGEQVGEVKHMYVSPRFRRQGLGRKLLGKLIGQSVAMGHTVLRLDSAWFMEAAHGLYRSFGFKEIGPYPESEVP
jgi:GNAT superfamily N-acetyltransferase